MLWISLAAAPHLAYWQIVAALALSDVGFGAAIPAIHTARLPWPGALAGLAAAQPPTFANCRNLFS